MSNPVDSANLLLKLYELRREETMRKARDFMIGFDPKSFEELQAAFMGPNSAYIRMTTSYWEMAASFVMNGAIDAKMFNDANGEHLVLFARLEPFLPEMRQSMNPSALKNLEEVCMTIPNARERIDAVRERMRKVLAMRAAAAQAHPQENKS